MAKKPARIDKRIDVILLENDKHLGEKYEVVKVKAIFAKNVLFPLSRAVLATTNYINTYKLKMEAAAKAKVKKAESLTELFEKVTQDDGLQFVMKANEKGLLYEKIDAAHLAARIHELYKIEVGEHYFKMKKKILTVGEYTVPFQYGTVDKDITVVVKAEKAKDAKEEAKTEEVA